MKRVNRQLIFLAMFCFSCTSSPAIASTPSVTPAAGMEWKNIPELKIDIAMPKGWFYKWARQGNAEAFFITKENIDDTGMYVTGLGVNINPNVENADSEAESFITSNIPNLDTTTKVLGKAIKADGKSGVVKLFGIIVEAELSITPQEPAQTTQKTLGYFAVSNTETHTLYILIFEAPRESWASEWNSFGSEMVFSFFSAIDGSQ